MLEASLLDDARFLEELAKIEALPTEDTSVFPKPVPTVDGNQPPTAIADAPPAFGLRTKGPQFVLAPPPSKRRSSSYRSSSRSSARARTAAIDDAPAVATATENMVTAEDFSRATSDQGSKPALEPVRAAENNTEVDASLSAFPSESARAMVNANTDGTCASDSKRSAPLHPVLAVVGFVLMMSVGAGVAALVFHDRVTQIVELLELSAERR